MAAPDRASLSLPESLCLRHFYQTFDMLIVIAEVQEHIFIFIDVIKPSVAVLSKNPAVFIVNPESAGILCRNYDIALPVINRAGRRRGQFHFLMDM